MKRIIQRVAAIVIGIGFGAVALAGLESVTHISDLNSSWPLGSDLASTSDDHIRNIKVALKTDFPNINAAVTATPTQLNQLTGVSVATGDILYASGANQLARLADIGAGAFLRSGGVGAAPQWSGLVIPNSASQGDLLYASASNNIATLAKDANATRYLSNTGSSNSPAWAQINLANGVTGNLLSSNLDLTMTPTWTGTHTFSKAGSGASGAIYNSSTQPSYVWQATGANANAKKWEFIAGASNLLLRTLNDAENAVGNVLNASRNASSQAITDVSLGNATDNPTYTFLGTGLATFNGSAAVVGGMVMGAPTGGNKGAGTLNAGNLYVNGVAVATGGAATTGTFTGTVTGMTAGLTGTVNYSVTNNIATMWVITAISGTSNVGTMTMTGLPAAVQPSNPVQGVSLVTDTGATAFGAWRISGSTVTFQLNAASAFTTSGTKGILGGWTITYPL